MTKKLLSLLLSLTLIMTVIFIPSTVTVNAAENTAIYDGYFFMQDFEDIEANDWGVGTVVGNGKYEVKEDENGNHYLEIGLKNDGAEAFKNTNNQAAIPANLANWSISFDVQKVSDGLPIGMEYYAGTNGVGSGFAIDSTNFENTEDWYRVAYTGDGANVTVVITNLTTGVTKRVHYGDIDKLGSYWHIGALSSMNCTLRLMIPNNAKMKGAIPAGYTAMDTCYRVDNVRWWDGNILDDVIFEDNGGNQLTEIPNGNVTAKAVVTSDSFARWEEARTTHLTTVLTAYDEDGKMIASSIETHNIVSENPVTSDAITERNVTWAATKTLESSIDLTGLNAKWVEMAVWDSEDGMRPIGKSYVLGTADEVSASETTADMGDATDISGRANDFVALDRSTKGSLVTVEGKADTNKATNIAIIAKGNNSGNTVYARQITTANDGSFKLTFDANEEFMSGDTGIQVTLSGATVNPKILNIVVGSDWTAFVDSFKAIDDADSAKAFYEDYASNLTYYNAGEESAELVDVSGLENSDWENLAFLHSTKNYGKMTSGDVIAEAETLVAALDDIDSFVDALNNAKNTDGIGEEKAAAVLAVIEAEDAPATFGFGAASNKLAVCAELAKCEDFASIQEAYSIFRDLTNAQAGLEASALSGFKAISSADSAKAFFASENGETLGITAEDLGYTDAEWAFFYEGYADNNCSAVEDAAGMTAAISAVREYVDDVNEFIASAATVGDGYDTKTLFEAEYSADSFFGKKMAVLEDAGMNLEGIGNADFFYEELFAALKVEGACVDMTAIAATYESAKNAEIEFENLAVAALNDATSKASAAEFARIYAPVLKLAAVSAYTDRQATIFAEINVKNGTNATTYAEAVEMLATLSGKVAEAEATLDAMKEAAKTDSWETLLALVEGSPSSETTVLESYIGAFDTSAITDKRALYVRFAKGGNTTEADINAYVDETFYSITSICDPFDTAYETQLDWEQNKGAYESTDGTLANFDESAWAVETMANVVKISGKVDKTGAHRLVFVVTVDDVPIFYKQIETEGTGNFTTNLVLNPDTEKFPAYRAGEDVATVRIISDTVNSYKLPAIDLFGAEELTSILTDFASIADKNSDDEKAAALEQFIEDYGDILGITEKVEQAIAYGDADISESAKKARVYHAMVFVYNKYSESYEGLEDVTEVVNGKDGESGTDAIVREMEKIVSLLDEMTVAANVKMNGTVGRWSLIRDLVEDAEDNKWVTLNGSTSGMSKSQIEDVYTEMTAKDYIKLSDIEDNYEDAVETVKDQMADSNNKPGGGGSSGGGGGGGKVSVMPIGGDYNKTEEGTANVDPEKLPTAPFTDLGDYAWASESIEGLRKYGLVKGDGSGKYRPGAEISREEFLTILCRMFDVDTTDAKAVTFTDVDPNAWYANTVAKACEMGIVNGYGDGRFGIGDSINRADMAIMILRMCEKQGVNLNPVEEAIVFNDYADIPEYAYYGIGILQQADILNGDDYGNFNATMNLSRAEAAVAFYNIFRMTKDFVTYTWMTTY